MRFLLLALVCILPLASGAQPIAERHALTFEGAQMIADAALAEAQANDWNVVIVVADARGDVLHLQRMNGVQLGSLEIAQRKARTAALYRRPTKVFADRLAEGNEAMHQLPDVIALDGGLPIVVDGEVIGSVGVSGVRGDQDAEIAQAGIDALLTALAE